MTASLAGSGDVTVAAQEYAGAASSNVVDASAHASGSGATATSGTAATSASGDLLFEATTHSDGSDVAASAGAGFTLRQSQPTNSTVDALFTEDMTAGPPGGCAGTFAYAQSVSYRDAQRQPIGYGYRHVHTYGDRDGDSNQHEHVDRHPDSHDLPDSIAERHEPSYHDADLHGHADGHPHLHRDFVEYTVLHGDSHVDELAKRYSDAYLHSDERADGH